MIQDIFPNTEAILLDTNLFVVFVVGFVELSLWGRAPVDGYDRADFLLLAKTLGEFRRVVTTPFVVAEVNSLINTTYAREECRTGLAAIVPSIAELYEPSKRLAFEPGIPRFGFTDISILRTARDTKAFVLSADGPLVQYLQGQKVAALHYTDWKKIAAM